MNATLEFFVSSDELDYLKELVSHDETVAHLIKVPQGIPGRKVPIRLNRADAAQLRELLMARMDKGGFDENYEPNVEGKMLETLIDRFFVR